MTSPATVDPLHRDAPAPGPSSAVPAHAPGATPPLALALGALGIVYGDIGTSPLYAFKECLQGPHRVAPTEANVLGLLSLMVWSLTMVVTVKYLFFIMRADNEGEGGILALLALVPPRLRAGGARASSPLVLLVLFGAAMLYGDGVITPAISVLSAVEGLNVGVRGVEHYVLPLTLAILVALFAAQRRGTGGIGVVFGPLMLAWFGIIALLGAAGVAKNPHVLRALSPTYAFELLGRAGPHGFLVLGAVVLCITGGEALYADMGHFGRKPIRLAWFLVVMPSLVLNYFGQGALVLADPSAAESPFYALVPGPFVLPMVVLATAATVIASQALISGAFSLTRQAVQLGYFPRVTVVHTSRAQAGQIYVPEVNYGLMLACLYLVVTFKTSTSLAAAYGIAVTGTMAITSIVYYVVTTEAWGWSRWKALPLVALFLAIDVAFFGANALKLFDGGWVPIAMAAAIFTLMTTWKAGRARLARKIAEGSLPLADFLDALGAKPPTRVPGTAVFMSANPDVTPPVLRHHYRHNHVLHGQVIILSVLGEPVPAVSPKNRLKVRDLGAGFYQVSARFGFMETPRVPALLEACALYDLTIDPEHVTFFLGRETLLSSSREGMWRWRKALFAFVSRNARSATAYFGIPPDRVVELGMQIEL
ncbi:MAG TPA: potassium transporter Kup [Polyangiaceae bacterium]|nr:potassium transporter Kup [Polyangiaceae bacterium]